LENNKSSQKLETPKTEDHKHSIVNIITAATLIAQVHTEIFFHLALSFNVWPLACYLKKDLSPSFSATIKLHSV
jgi:hypothetical protein